MKTVYLHIGHGKTGTSGFQSLLARGQKKLRKNKILYPDHPSLSGARANSITTGNLTVSADDNWLINKIIPTIEANPGYESYIFSSEFLFWHQAPLVQGCEQYRKDLNFKVLLCIRNPLEMLSSTYQQLVKRDGYCDVFDRFLISLNFTEPHLVHAAQLVQLYESLNIDYVLLNYSHYGFGVTRRLAEIIGIDSLLNKRILNTPNVNRSLDVAELQLLLMVNSIMGREAGILLSDLLVNKLPDKPSNSLPISSDERAKLYENIKPSLDLLNARLPAQEQIAVEEPRDGDNGVIHFLLDDDQIKIAKDALLEWYAIYSVQSREPLLSCTELSGDLLSADGIDHSI
jgi:hypothetical protein